MIYLYFQVLLYVIILFISITAVENDHHCKLIKTPKNSDRSVAGSGNGKLWPNRRIPYTLDFNLRNTDESNFLGAIAEYHRKTCLRFEPYTENDDNSIHIKMTFKSTEPCGTAHLCMQGTGSQVVLIRDDCSTIQSFIHELGHVVCLNHEHIRVDRDDYLDQEKCTNRRTIEKIEDGLTTRGHLYDYHSQMHYECREGCIGYPRTEGVKKCGPDANPQSLSVIDADKLNAFYNCKGCFGHRWYRVDTLTSEQESSLVNFASDQEKKPAYMCRGFSKGIIATGTYNATDKTCSIAAANTFEIVTKHIQLFALPNGVGKIPRKTDSGYYLKSPFTGEKNFVPVGRTLENENLYAAVMHILRDGQKRTVFGYIISGYLRSAWFSFSGGRSPIPPRDPDDPSMLVLSCK